MSSMGGNDILADAGVTPRTSRVLSSQGAPLPTPVTAAPAITPEQARSEGYEAARRELQEQHEKLAGDLKVETEALQEKLHARERAFSAALAALENAQRDHARTVEATLARLTALAAGRLLHTLAAQQQLATETARSVLAQYAGMPGLQLVLSPADHASVSRELQDSAAFVADPALKPGEFRVLLPHRQLDMNITRQYLALCELLQDESDSAG